MNNKVIETLADVEVAVAFQEYLGSDTTYITFFKYNCMIEQYSNDEPELEGHYYQIDIWSLSDYTELENKVKQKMKSAGFRFIDEADFYEKDTKIYHKGIRYFIPLFLI